MTEFSALLRQWVDDQWPNLNLKEFVLNPCSYSPDDKAPEWDRLSGDAGFRRYFRLFSKPSMLAVYAPPSTEDMDAFINIGQHLRRHGVLAPAIAAFDRPQGFMLIEDFGASMLFDELNNDTVESLYSQALNGLLKIQLTPKNSDVLPIYSANKLYSEMALFTEWFVPELLAYEMADEERQVLEDWFTLLQQSALEQSQVVVHRDYHSRNLVYREDGLPGVIDFQDAVIGPMTYDVVSLLRDCYISWPDDKVRRWALSYAKIAAESGVCQPVSEQQYLRWFDLMGLQRHIKVLGIFARLSLRDGKHGYLNDLPLVIEYVLRISKNYPEAKLFVDWFELKLMPLIKQQAWFNPQ